MKISAVLEEQTEVLQRCSNNAHTANEIAQQLVRVALSRTGRGPQARKLAHQLADRFASVVAQEIDKEFEYHQAKDINEVI